MSSSKLAHSKYKNTGILFELLARQVTADTLGGQDVSPALNIIREFFNPITELGKELQLYRALIEAGKLSDVKALKLIDLVLEQRKLLNSTKLNEQKYRLVKAIGSAYPLKEFLASKIPNYKVHASIYKTFIAGTNPSVIGPMDISTVAQARFTIVEHLAAKASGPQVRKNTLLESYKVEQEDLRLLTYRILVDRFNEKYKTLNGQQKVLLREFINNISNTNSLREHINTEVPKIKREIQRRVKGVDDKVVRIKLGEVVNQLETIKKGKTVRDHQVTALMIAYEIVKELDHVREE